LKKLVLSAIVGLIIFILTSIVSFALHFGLWLLPLGDTLAIASLLSLHVAYWLDIFHTSYLLVVSFTFALIGVTWLVAIAPRYPKLRQLQIAAIPPLSLLCAGLLCSVFWAIRGHWVLHDIQPVPFPSLHRLVTLIWLGARRGLALGPLIAFYSFPWNLLWCIAAYFIIATCRERLISADSKSVFFNVCAANTRCT
jgi:hypothetical protein